MERGGGRKSSKGTNPEKLLQYKLLGRERRSLEKEEERGAEVVSRSSTKDRRDSV